MIGIGCDIVAFERITALMQKKGYERIFTKHEQHLCEELHGQRRVEWIAGRFAAKEAIIKAFAKEKALMLSQVEVLYDGTCPACTMEGYQVHISIAHEKAYAIAYAMVERKEE